MPTLDQLEAERAAEAAAAAAAAAAARRRRPSNRPRSLRRRRMLPRSRRRCRRLTRPPWLPARPPPSARSWGWVRLRTISSERPSTNGWRVRTGTGSSRPSTPCGRGAAAIPGSRSPTTPSSTASTSSAMTSRCTGWTSLRTSIASRRGWSRCCSARALTTTRSTCRSASVTPSTARSATVPSLQPPWTLRCRCPRRWGSGARARSSPCPRSGASCCGASCWGASRRAWSSSSWRARSRGWRASGTSWASGAARV